MRNGQQTGVTTHTVCTPGASTISRHHQSSGSIHAIELTRIASEQSGQPASGQQNSIELSIGCHLETVAVKDEEGVVALYDILHSLSVQGYGNRIPLAIRSERIDFSGPSLLRKHHQPVIEQTGLEPASGSQLLASGHFLPYKRVGLFLMQIHPDGVRTVACSIR